MTHLTEPIPSRPPKKKKNGSARKASQLELRKALEELSIPVSFDEFKLAVMLEKPLHRPGIAPLGNFMPRPWADTDDTALAEILNANGFPSAIKNGLIRDVVLLHAITKRSHHPVRAYLDSLVWDGVSRIDSFFQNYCGSHAATADEQKYLRVVARITFVAPVARVFEPGCKHDCLPILEGPQGSEKSELIRVLARRSEWLAENLPDEFNKDMLLLLLGRWLVELPEIDRHLKATSKMKAFASTATDRFRPPFARSVIDVPRQCCFIGTTNNELYLYDDTGNRRYQPVKVDSIDIDSVKAAADQLWAEAVALYRDRVPWWPVGDDIVNLLRDQAEARMVVDPWEALIEKQITLRQTDHDANGITTAEAFSYLQVPDGKRERCDEMRIATILKKLGFTERKRETSGKRLYIFRKPPTPEAQQRRPNTAVKCAAAECNESKGRDDDPSSERTPAMPAAEGRRTLDA
jgi:predicted P-loop ATPase